MRIKSIDTIRGITILLMIIGNATPYIFPNQNLPIFIHWLYSLGAPTFIFLSSYVLCSNIDNGKNIKLLYKRSFQVLFVAIFIDIFYNKINPFYTFDVLYLIGFSSIIILLIRKFSILFKTILFCLVIIVFFWFQKNMEYRYEIKDPVAVWKDLIVGNWNDRWWRFIWDGWFPVFPWLSLFLLGYLFKKIQTKCIPYKKHFLIIGLPLFIISSIVIILNQQFIPREEFYEIFYPIKDYFWLVLIGLYLIIMYGIMSPNFYLPHVNEIGKISLIAYSIHLLFINHLLIPFMDIFGNNFSLIQHLIVCAIFFIIVLDCVLIIFKNLQKLKTIKFLKPILYILGA